MKSENKELVTAEDMIEKLGLEKHNSFLDIVMWRLSCLIVVPLSLIVVVFRLIQFRGFNCNYYFLEPKSFLGKWFYKWRDNAI